MASVIILGPSSVDSAPRPGVSPARASAVNDARALGNRRTADDTPEFPREVEIETPAREDEGAAGKLQMGRRALTLTAERRSSAWRWDEQPDDATHTPVGFAAQRIAQEMLAPGAYHEDFRSALAAYSYVTGTDAGATARPDGVSILV